MAPSVTRAGLREEGRRGLSRASAGRSPRGGQGQAGPRLWAGGGSPRAPRRATRVTPLPCLEGEPPLPLPRPVPGVALVGSPEAAPLPLGPGPGRGPSRTPSPQVRPSWAPRPPPTRHLGNFSRVFASFEKTRKHKKSHPRPHRHLPLPRSSWRFPTHFWVPLSKTQRPSPRSLSNPRLANPRLHCRSGFRSFSGKARLRVRDRKQRPRRGETGRRPFWVS